MSLNKDDISVLESWFTELQTYKKTKKEKYTPLRDKIYKFLYHKFSDLLGTKTYEWNKKFALSDDDVNSIFNDVLLNCVEHYHPHEVKFLTYFWKSCDNQAKNYYKKYRCKRRIPPASVFNVDFSSLSYDTSNSAETTAVAMDILDQIRNLYDESSTNADVSETVTGYLEELNTKLSSPETIILQRIVTGSSLSSIARDMQMDLKEVYKSLKNIRKKAKYVLKNYE